MNITFLLDSLLNPSITKAEINKIIDEMFTKKFNNVANQLSKEGNNISLLLPIENHPNRKKIENIVYKAFKKKKININNINTCDNDIINELKKNKTKLVITTNKDNARNIANVSKVLIIGNEKIENYDNLNINYLEDNNDIYNVINKIKYEYINQIKPLSGIPSIDKKYEGYYFPIQNNFDVPEKTIWQYLLETNSFNPNRKVIDYFGKTMNFKQFKKKIIKCSKAYASYGLKKGDAITIAMPNTPEGLIAFYAANRIGLVANMVHPKTSENEMLDYITDVDSKLVVCLDQCVEKINNIKDKTNLKKIVYVKPSESMPLYLKVAYELFKNKYKNITTNDLVETWNDFISKSKNVSYVEENKYTKGEVAVVLRTGGTSGTSKGAELSNESFNANIEQLKVIAPSYQRGDSILAVTPIFHGFGLANCVHTALCLEMFVTLLPEFQLKNFIKTMLRTKANLIIGVPTLWKSLTESEMLKDKDLSFIKVLISGGDKLAEKTEKEINEFLIKHNAPNKVYKGYGLTEGLAAITFSTDNANDLSTIGIPLPGNNIKIVKPGTSEELGYNQEGEICISGPTIMNQYHDNENETNATIKEHEDGKKWVHTGDIGYMNENGQIFYSQRLKRMIISSGYNVYPSQIEDVIYKHSAVDNCVVVGVPHKYKVEVPKAYVVLKDKNADQKLKLKIEKEIFEMCRINLSKMSYPREIAFVKELPRTGVGKTDYRKLANENKMIEEIEEIEILEETPKAK